MIGFISIFYSPSSSQSIIALSLIYPLHKSLRHATFSFSFSFILLHTLLIIPRHASHGKRRLVLSTMHVYWSVTQQWMSYC
jgi:hypothetical protein